MAENEPQERQPPSIVTIEVRPAGNGPRAAEFEPYGAIADDEEEDGGPVEIDAGAALELVAVIRTVPERDLSDLSIRYLDAEGVEIGSAGIDAVENGENRTVALTLRAPPETGECTWLAILPAHVVDDVAYEEVATPFTFTVTAHETTLLVWDVPTAIVAGEPFRFKLGVKCSSACTGTGWTYEVRDQEGGLAASGGFGDEPSEGTNALYWAEVEARAPAIAGLYDWAASAPGDAVSGHKSATARIGVRSVPQPECLVTVEAIDEETQSPIRGAKVAIHPYRVVTDENGRAEVRVPKGHYRIFVSGGDHFPYRAEADIEADTTIRAELAMDRPPSIADTWA